jgi:hypothetical protein
METAKERITEKKIWRGQEITVTVVKEEPVKRCDPPRRLINHSETDSRSHKEILFDQVIPLWR